MNSMNTPRLVYHLRADRLDTTNAVVMSQFLRAAYTGGVLMEDLVEVKNRAGRTVFLGDAWLFYAAIQAVEGNVRDAQKEWMDSMQYAKESLEEVADLPFHDPGLDAEELQYLEQKGVLEEVGAPEWLYDMEPRYKFRFDMGHQQYVAELHDSSSEDFEGEKFTSGERYLNIEAVY